VIGEPPACSDILFTEPADQDYRDTLKANHPTKADGHQVQPPQSCGAGAVCGKAEGSKYYVSPGAHPGRHSTSRKSRACSLLLFVGEALKAPC